ISEEKKNKTDQCLLTSPVSLFGIVAGKFLAAFLIYALGVAITLVYAVVVSAFAAPDWTVIFGNVVGLVLLGAAFIAVGIFCSSFTENQIVSAVVSFIALTMLYLFTTIGNLIPIEFISNIFSKLSFLERYYGFTYGLFDLSNVLFFISATVVFLFLSVRVMERRRWA
ncbi:MAG: ABC transporter permease, partial [Ruminococcus sp.]|nr:ABC transporter permease [Ruminococcus sp.]